MKKLLALLLCLSLIFCFTACGKNTATVDGGTDAESQAEPEVTYTNPLTGLSGYKTDISSKRPVCCMINNVRIAQKVQTGLNKADIVFETEVEGGITRLLAVFKDISSVGQLGTVRSARVPYIDIALGFDAVYVHCGIDPTYAAPHVKETGVEDFDINTGKWSKYGFRESNGLALEHTMYTSGEKISTGISELGIRSTTDKTSSFTNFAQEGSERTPANSCKYVKITFSNGVASTFDYNTETKMYNRGFNDEDRLDYKTGEQITTKNIFILQTTISNYPDGKHRKVDLSSGKGWYVSEGGYEEIKWSKGSSSNQFTFTKADGSEFVCNPGRSWICIQNSAFSPSFVPFDTAQ